MRLFDVEQTLRLAQGTLNRSEGRVSSQRLGALFDAHHLRLYRLARRMSGDPDEARDLVQQTFLRVARRPASIPQDESGAESWLVRTLVNLCRDRYRRLQVRQRASGQMPDGHQPANPEAVAVARATVEAALARLSPRRRAVLVLHLLEEREIKEVSCLLGISPVTSRWHLAAARRDLKRILLEQKEKPRKQRQ